MSEEEIGTALAKAIFLDQDEAVPLFEKVLAGIKAHDNIESLKTAITQLGVNPNGMSAYAFKADKFIHTLDQGLELYQYLQSVFPKCLCKTHISQAKEAILLIILGENHVNAYVQVSAQRAIAKALKLPYEITVGLNAPAETKSSIREGSALNSTPADSYAGKIPPGTKVN